jgi:hypothetical protein
LHAIKLPGQHVGSPAGWYSRKLSGLQCLRSAGQQRDRPAAWQARKIAGHQTGRPEFGLAVQQPSRLEGHQTAGQQSHCPAGSPSSRLIG